MIAAKTDAKGQAEEFVRMVAIERELVELQGEKVKEAGQLKGRSG